MGFDTIVILLALGIVIFFLKNKKQTKFPSVRKKNKQANKLAGHSNEDHAQNIEHKKKYHLATKNEQKLFFALQKVLDKKYIVHCQTSLIALVEPIERKHKGKAWSKRMDFVITDKATKILAVIELDDSSHNLPKRIERDKYVNHALDSNHPLIRIPSENFYTPEKIADLLEKKAGIPNTFSMLAVQV